ncbi:hypothetical protein [Vagococcus silagei]|uniref:Tetratricopeptide repeat protein n=1 Tax=Vagococcus silagei TaxID=2508885 RepID=A0A4S3B7N5_9ENTE|nr:hypothetical protein [Vagococcus silagei]THB62100.1 hypothetical protein ESZ54_02520 [Vagococcus silagei]
MDKLPDLSEKHLRLARAAQNEEKYDEALYHFEAGYEEEQTYHNCRQLVAFLLSQRAWQEAGDYLADFEAQFMYDAEGFPLYIKLLVQQHRFLKIAIAMEQAPKDIVLNQRKFVDAASNSYVILEREFLDEKIKQLKMIPTLCASEQLLVSQQAQFLTKELFVETVITLLASPNVHPILISEWFNQLVLLKVNASTDVYCIDGVVRSFVPVEMPALSQAFRDSELLIEITATLNQKVPALVESGRSLVKLHFGLSYPFIESYQENWPIWLAIYLEMLGLMNSNELEEDEVKAKLQQQLSQLESQIQKIQKV